MKKQDILKMTGLSEEEFYNKYPTQDSFMMEYGGMVNQYATGSYTAKDAAAGKDLGKPGKNFAKIANKAAEKYGSKEAGERVAGAILANLRGKRENGGMTPTPTGDIFDMMGMSYLNAFANGGYTPMYGFGDTIKDVGKLWVNTVAAPIEQISGNNFVNFDYDNKWAADTAAVSEGIIGAGTDVAGTMLAGPLYGMGKQQLQGVTKNIGNSQEYQKGANKWANQTGQISSSAGDLTAGIISGNPQQIIGGAGNILGTTGQQTDIQELGQLGQLAGFGAMFAGTGQNAMGTMKNGGGVNYYSNNINKFANGGMTIGNVESGELLIDPNRLEGGGVPKILTSYTSPNLPPHPEDGSIDNRGTVSLPAGKFIITTATANKYKNAKNSNDGLYADAIMNNINIKKAKKEQAEQTAAMSAYERFMSKYGGTIEKMYKCGGGVYGCGGSTKKYDGGAGVMPNFLPSYINSPSMPPGGIPNKYPSTTLFPAAPSSLNLNYNQPVSTATSPNLNMFGQQGSYMNTANIPNTGITDMTPDPSYFSGFNTAGQTVSINPDMQSQYNTGWRPEGASLQKFPSPQKNNITTDLLTAGMLAPAAYNIGRGLFSKVTQVPSDLGITSADITAPRLSDQQGKRLIREQMNLAKYNAGQLGSSNVLPFLNTAGIGGMKAYADYAENLQNKQATLDYDATTRNKAIQQANAAQRAQNWMLQQQMQAQKDNFLSTGISNLGTAAGGLRQENVMKDVYKDLYSNYDYKNGRWTYKS